MIDHYPPLTDITRLSLNQYTTQRWGVREAVEGCARARIPAIGLWRDKVGAMGVTQSTKIVRDAGLTVSSLCRGGMFAALTADERKRALDENRRAIDEAATLGTDVLVLACGGLNECPLDDARQMVEDGIALLMPYAAKRGVKLGIEPQHPMFGADRSVIVTLGQANDIVERLDSPQVGVVIDVYHVWWDPRIYDEIARASGHILGFQVNDWIAPLPDVLIGRAMMGDGVINLRRMRAAVEQAGYHGYIEVEIFNRKIWNTPGDDVLALVIERYLQHV